MAAPRTSLPWEMLAQAAAQALRDEELLALAASHCHPQTPRQIRWTDTLLREQAPQARTSR
ncbi:hypothetical protein [Streptomyces sp. NPDC001388]|uniref:hypothetical protein n=1 Tax=unclassified Streptomyces TaxID=2593676 RepID=UPI0036990515